MRVPVVAAVIGELLLYFGAAFGPPLVLAILDGEAQTAVGFATAMGIALALGTVAHAAFRRRSELTLHRTEALAIVAGTWLVFGSIGTIPYMFCGLSFVDSLFESISGFTTTGATILTNFNDFDRAFFLWRAMTQWFGGLGVIALFVVVLPRLGIAGRQLFFAEASDAAADGPRPRVRAAAARLWVLYSALTALLVACLMLTGMDAFDAVCNSLTTLSAGGFSPNGMSIAGYANPAAEWILIPFMLISGTSFTLLYRALTGSPMAPFKDAEFRVFYGVSIIGGLLVGWVFSGGLDFESVRHGLFQSASVISSTGFASQDFELWNEQSKALLLVLMFIGGCAGSAAGGPKVVRLLIFGRYVTQSITRTIHPAAITPYKYQGKVMPGRVMRSVISLVVLYFVGYAALGATLVLMGVEMETGFTAALACLGNIGPAYGVAGPMGSYASFSVPAKLTLTLAMWVGRLEIVTVLVLLHPDFWRNIRLKDRPSRPPRQIRVKTREEAVETV
ncbi:MAG: trk system potassium uptake protein TrkH [Bradymonadia bacterium]